MKKKLLLFIAGAGFAIGANAQTQRTVLAEEFTQASCPPCASQNPAFNALLQANGSTVVAVKYQTNWPGVDPMNVQTQTDVGPRVTYYNCTGVPYAPMDGSVANVSSPNYAGAPANWTQPIINTEQAIMSPFSLSVSHTMSAGFDSAFVTVVVTAAQNFTSSGALKLQLAMTEKTVTFATPPGSNGETVFYNVMRKMYPSASGTTLASSWTNAQTQTFNFAIALPNYIYDKGQVNFVAFIQDDGNKAVEQAAGDQPIAITNDASVTAVTGVTGLSCTGNFTPVVTLKNMGAVTLTSCNIMAQVDASAPVSFAWSGSLAVGATTNVTLPAITAGAGSHTFTTWDASPNGTPDVNTNFDTQVSNFTVSTAAGVVLPLANNFSSAAFPYANWTLNNPDAGTTWAHVTTNGGSAEYDCYSYGTVGAIDEFIVEPVDLTSMTNASLQFNVAHRQYSASYTDALSVLVSTDCGATWTQLWSKSGATLSTVAGYTTSPFVPTSAQWRAECINLSSYSGNNKVFIMFRGTNGYGNNIYVDDINVSNVVCPTGVEEHTALNGIDIIPNPFDQQANVSIDLANSSDVTVEVYTMTGELVSKQDAGTLSSGKQVIAINGAELASGMYFVTVRAGETTVTRKVSVSH
ncbi:MAG: Omp28-related outer membrane protein [Bacteroidetes bacterium]|nr:Omp28-related outer membrane protein [Bacteroidota bacterium]